MKTIKDEYPATRKRVLVADDVPTVLSAVAKLLEDSFDVVDLAGDGRSALDATLALDPDLVVLDVSMPVLNGIEVGRELKRRGNRTKVVFLTVHEDSDVIASCLAAGGSGYVVKELMNSDLVTAIREALAGRTFLSRLSSSQK